MSASLEHSAYPAPLPSLERLEAALAEAIAEARKLGGTTLLSVPAPVAPSETLLLGRMDDACAWAAPDGYEFAALGFAHVVEASGSGRFRRIAQAGSELIGRTRSLALLGAPAQSPRLFGGFSFTAEAPHTESWHPFGEARFVLPELAYVVEGHEARLVLALHGEPDRDALVASAVSAFATLARPRAPTPAGSVVVLGRSARPESEWTTLVEGIRAEIARGTLEKVVLARRVSVELEREPEVSVVLTRLRQQAPECTRFLLRRDGVSFLGATPEWLARKRGPTLETAALAGSMSALDARGAARLLESGKDHAEHAFVVQEILRALSPLASHIEQSEQPELYQLKHVLHLRSRIRATLRNNPHLLHVVEQLHPTPAVGGVPSGRALEWIGSHEPDERGWYAGPIGWFDGAGDGEMAVALRSGVLSGRRAELYGGAGIVDRSSAPAEFAETGWKLAALLSALGVQE